VRAGFSSPARTEVRISAENHATTSSILDHTPILPAIRIWLALLGTSRTAQSSPRPAPCLWASSSATSACFFSSFSALMEPSTKDGPRQQMVDCYKLLRRYFRLSTINRSDRIQV